MYDSFISQNDDDFAAFFRRYTPRVLAGRHTCVGLGLELLERLPPTSKGAAYIVSCEESIEDVRDYLEDPDDTTVEKEHVMVAVRIAVEGRIGVMLCDPGYHVARVVTVMRDLRYPHTGRFTQSDEPHCKKEYNYVFNANDPDYIEWIEKETRDGTEPKYQTSLVYAARAFLNPVDVTERRNLVYNFRSLLARDQKGHLVAGVYFPVVTAKDAAVTLFYEHKSVKQRVKHKFATFAHADAQPIPPQTLDQVSACASQMGYTFAELLAIITKLATIMADTSFITQMLQINEDICTLSADN